MLVIHRVFVEICLHSYCFDLVNPSQWNLLNLNFATKTFPFLSLTWSYQILVTHFKNMYTTHTIFVLSFGSVRFICVYIQLEQNSSWHEVKMIGISKGCFLLSCTHYEDILNYHKAHYADPLFCGGL